MNLAYIRVLGVALHSSLAWLALFPAGSPAQQGPRNIERVQDAERPPMTWAVLIGIEQYDNYRPALYADQDARLLRETLESRGQYDSVESLSILSPVGELADEKPNTFQADHATIMRQVPKFLAQAQPRDRVIFFFSGHGHLAEDGSTYLGPSDINVAKLQRAIPLADVRDMLDRCRAATKLLILDACHAGNPKGDGAASQGITSKEIEVVLKEATGIHTLASCQAAQQSWPDDRTRQGLYTWWLNRGLQGAADRDGDFKISPSELHAFVRDPVRLASLRIGSEQTPGQIVGPEVKEEPILVLRPDNWADALPRVADLLHEQLARSQPRRVGVVEFFRRDGQREQLGQLGVFGSFAADKVEESLQVATQREVKPPYTLVARRLVEGAARGKTIDQVFNNQANMKQLGQAAQVDVIVTGAFQPLDQPPRFNLKCEAIQLDSGAVIATASTVIHADASLLSALGVSWTSPQVAEPAPGAATGELASFLRPLPEFSLNNAPDNPLLQQESPVGVEIRAEGRTLQIVRDPNDKDGMVNTVFVPARPNQKFDIWIRNDLARDLIVRVYIDGLNVVNKTPMDQQDQGYLIHRAKSHRPVGGWRKVWIVEDEVQEEINDFTFVNPANAVAAKRGFGDRIGQITIVISEARPMAWLNNLGVGEGQRQLFRTYERHNLCEGRQLYSITLNYVDAATIPKAQH